MAAPAKTKSARALPMQGSLSLAIFERAKRLFIA
jgi:hypothetical protein